MTDEFYLLSEAAGYVNGITAAQLEKLCEAGRLVPSKKGLCNEEGQPLCMKDIISRFAIGGKVIEVREIDGKLRIIGPGITREALDTLVKEGCIEPL